MEVCRLQDRLAQAATMAMESAAAWGPALLQPPPPPGGKSAADEKTAVAAAVTAAAMAVLEMEAAEAAATARGLQAELQALREQYHRAAAETDHLRTQLLVEQTVPPPAPPTQLAIRQRSQSGQSDLGSGEVDCSDSDSDHSQTPRSNPSGRGRSQSSTDGSTEAAKENLTGGDSPAAAMAPPESPAVAVGSGNGRGRGAAVVTESAMESPRLSPVNWSGGDGCTRSGADQDQLAVLAGQAAHMAELIGSVAHALHQNSAEPALCVSALQKLLHVGAKKHHRIRKTGKTGSRPTNPTSSSGRSGRRRQTPRAGPSPGRALVLDLVAPPPQVSPNTTGLSDVEL